ncbi:MAG TPA: SRPBCC domain-containing protein [Flavobacterium sp.]|jgi:uncharacterized protein YndB with AHSA1/START domain
MDTTPVIVERTFNVLPSEIWSAITDNSKLQQWYFRLSEFKPEPGFRFTFTGGPEDGPQYVHLCEIVEVIPQERISYTWIYEGIPGETLVTVDLTPNERGTKVTLTHSGIETIATAGPDFAKSNFNQGWTYFIHTALKNFIEKQ